MKIKTFTYSRTWQHKQYEPERIEVTAEIADGEDPTVVAQEVKAYVIGQSQTASERLTKTQKKAKLEQLREEIEQLEDELDY